MPEPDSSPVRPTAMKSLALLALALALAGCGSAQRESAQSTGTDDSVSSRVGRCAGDSPAVRKARTLASVDLDGDGTPEAVKLTASGGECANTVFARTGEGFVSSAAGDGPPVTSAFAVAAPGREGQLLVTRADHPRGGFQLRVYAAGSGELNELEVDGNPLVPFVATDVQEHPLSVDCADGGLVVTEALTHEPMGARPGWDVKRTSYVVDGTSVQKGATEDLAENVSAQQLAAKYPELVQHSAFAGCRAS